MEKIISCVLLILIFVGVTIQPISAGQVVEINTLVEKAKEMDGQSVTVEGEAIGEPMIRGDFAWVNINDGTNAMGLWMKKENAQVINFYGDYSHKGDRLLVEGVFYRACPEHGGEADLHVKSLSVVKNGNEVEESVPFFKIMLAFGTCLAAVITLRVFLKRRS